MVLITGIPPSIIPMPPFGGTGKLVRCQLLNQPTFASEVPSRMGKRPIKRGQHITFCFKESLWHHLIIPYFLQGATGYDDAKEYDYIFLQFHDLNFCG